MGASVNGNLVECQQCGARVKETNLEKHQRERCKAEAQEKASRAQDVEGLWQKSNELAEAGNYQQAAEVCTKLMDLEPECIKAYVRRGIYQLKVGNPEAAEADFRGVLRTHPKNTTARKYLKEAKKLIEREGERSVPRPKGDSLSGTVVVFTGEGSFQQRSLVSLLPSSAKYFVNRGPESSKPCDVLVIGRNDFSKKLIRSLIERSGGPPRCLPQEGLIDELLLGRNWWDGDPSLLDDAIEKGHQGLAYAKYCFEGVKWRWPTTQAAESTKPSPKSPDKFPETDLEKLGYRTPDLLPEQRWDILVHTALPKLGLKKVADTIAGHCCRCKAQQGGKERYKKAISKWEHDLARLKQEYYDQGIYSGFAWPSTEGGSRSSSQKGR